MRTQTSIKHHNYLTPFGSVLQGRSWVESGVNKYRFGMNGQEKEEDVAGADNIYSAEYWMYDSRLGRRFNVDPKADPDESSYLAFKNSPLLFVDPNGLVAINGYKKVREEAKQKVSDKQNELNKLKDNKVDKKNKVEYAKYKAEIKAAKTALKEAKNKYKDAEQNYNKMEIILDEYAYNDPVGYNEINTLTTTNFDGTIKSVDVYYFFEPKFTGAEIIDGVQQKSTITNKGTHGYTEAMAISHTNASGELVGVDFTTQEFGQNTIIIRLSYYTSTKTVAHENGHAIYIAKHAFSYMQWKINNSKNYPEYNGHDTNDPSGAEATRREIEYEQLYYAKYKLRGTDIPPANFKR